MLEPFSCSATPAANPAATVRVHTALMPPGNPFDPENGPVSLTVPGRRVPSWSMAWTGRAAEDPPVSPVASDEPEQAVTLVPFGAQTLRVTTFPILGKPSARATVYKSDFKDGQAPTGWVAYGGGWFARGGLLHLAPSTANNGDVVAGVKSVATDTDFADFTYDADITPARAGDTGLIFRVAHPAIGPNAFDGYYAGINPEDGRVVIGKCTAENQWTELGHATAQVRAGTSAHLRVIAVGPKIEVYIDSADKPAVTATDGTFTHGSIGVRQYATDARAIAAGFGNVSVVAK